MTHNFIFLLRIRLHPVNFLTEWVIPERIPMGFYSADVGTAHLPAALMKKAPTFIEAFLF